MNYPNDDIKTLSGKVVGATESDRSRIVAEYLSVSNLIGNAERGALVFSQNCVACHRFKGQGNEVGPNLGSVAGNPNEYLLTAILDPSKSIDPHYTTYEVTTRDGEELTGVISEETPSSITLLQAGGTRQVLARRQIATLKSSKLSLMPDGFEKALTQQSMADLISFLKSK